MRSGDSKRWNKYPADVLPLWVADMDFDIAEPIVHALQTHIARFPLVYSNIDATYKQLVCDYIEGQYGWQVDEQWIVWTTGVVPGIYASVRAHVNQGQSVIIPTPIYPPFFQSAQQRKARAVPLTREGNQWRWHLPDALGDEAMMIICHPHNPTGKRFDRSELTEIAEYCCDNNLLLCSDEIYADLLLDDAKHTPIASINSDIAKRSITLMSAAKTWNISGMSTAFAIIPDEKLRLGFSQALQGISSEPSVLGVKATCAAFSQGQEWRQQMLQHLRDNRSFIDQRLAPLKSIDWIPNQATFLAWLRFADESSEAAWHRLYASGLALSQGTPFGDDSYLRLNYGCTRAHLEKAISIIEQNVC